jgi:hypothetical protein
MKSFQNYRDAVRLKAAELETTYPGGCVKIISIDNPVTGSVAGVVSEVSYFTASKAILDGTAIIMPEAAVTQEPEVVAQ